MHAFGHKCVPSSSFSSVFTLIFLCFHSYFPIFAGGFAPAGASTIWKKRLVKENTETVVYQQLMRDKVRDLVPRFYREVEYNGDCILFWCYCNTVFSLPYVQSK